MSDFVLEQTQANALETLKKHGKTFNFARLFLPKHTGEDAATLYQFCRFVDDVVDEAPSKTQAEKEIEKIRVALTSQNTLDPMVGPFIGLCSKHDIPIKYGLHLVHGVSQDLSDVSIQTTTELIQYAYYVAGVVGLMMAPILGSEKKGYPFAIDLGIAMQLTNIARDVLEDANNQRRYVPGDLVCNVSPAQISRPNEATKAKMSHAIKALLGIAEKYYESALIGLNYLPLKSRLAIRVAAVAYREIGRKLARREYAFWQGRVAVPSWHKAVLASKCLLIPDTLFSGDSIPQHQSTLHQPLQCILIQG